IHNEGTTEYILTYLQIKWIRLSSGDNIEQKQKQLSKEEGETASLKCTFSTSSTYFWVHWYRQYLGIAPGFILFNGSGNFQGRFHASPNKTMKTIPLTVQNVQLSDSAVYYCALSPTVRITFSHPLQKHLGTKNKVIL
uniref:Ig-like domain-containing protein n=1 Tax=Paramormyrops kingsleyae TaxID=1676925 RepID=A0A3B3Q248_9TELE